MTHRTQIPMRYAFLAGLLYTMIACQTQPGPSTTLIPVVAPNDSSHLQLIAQLYLHFNQHAWEQMAALYADTAIMKDPSFGTDAVSMSRADIVKKYLELQQMIPDVTDSVAGMYASGRFVTVEFVSKGTGPDGQPFRLPICTVFEIVDGKISKDHTYYDNVP